MTHRLQKVRRLRLAAGLVWIALLLITAVPACGQGSPAGYVPKIVTIGLHDSLQPTSVEILRSELAEANKQHPAAILLDLSTPGGWADSAEIMARMIRTSPAPVLVFARQPGTQVKGEGLRVLLAGKAVAMSPEARLVPLPHLHHVLERQRDRRNAERATLAEVLVAGVQRRGRNPELLRDLLQQDAEITPQQAMQAGLLDAIAPREETAVRALAQTDPARATVLLNSRTVALPMTSRQHLMRALMNPDLTVLLLTLGALLIFLEINTPGTILPGMAGVLLTLLSVYALLQMPLRWQGLVLLLLSALLLLAETQFARGAAYGVGAVVALTAGLRLLVRGPIPELEVDLSTSIGAGLGFGGITTGLVLLGVRARRAKTKTGAEAMLGWLAVAQTPLEPTGEVLVRGELWHAHLSQGNTFLAAGECVKVQSTDGSTLIVAPMTLNMQDPEGME